MLGAKTAAEISVMSCTDINTRYKQLVSASKTRSSKAHRDAAKAAAAVFKPFVDQCALTGTPLPIPGAPNVTQDTGGLPIGETQPLPPEYIAPGGQPYLVDEGAVMDVAYDPRALAHKMALVEPVPENKTRTYLLLAAVGAAALWWFTGRKG